MDIRHLQYFVEVAKHQSFSKASEKLYVSQPTVSKMVKNLEDEIGMALLLRSTKRKLELTDAGHVVYRQGQAIIQSFHNIASELDAIKNMKTGTIRMGIPPMTGSRFFSKIISGFHQKYPGISIKIIEDGSKSLEKQLLQGNLDLAVLALPVAPDAFDYIEIVNDDLQLLVHPAHPFSACNAVKLSDLQNESFILFREGFHLHEVIPAECRKAGFDPAVVCESSQWDFISEMVAENLGIALLPETICRLLDPTRVKTILLIEPSIPWHLAISWQKDNYLSYASKEFVTYTCESLQVDPRNKKRAGGAIE
ncbi:LysR substrate-binding domain-containing protein [Paenibacillus allorhizosphaerae]|uniref:HTH-type transcriptional regulator CynR n=1 Tax=Paenibacillus allorhizosphaerae TaxID=2849866 RepID=A0ABM8VQQ0_9BACL|nr:LysR family transcriptional regulator [Paenibacillus allorhizosphaerae]CAG7654452.1 HTH-type transcriptional regulator CynR [Paenibacillus allorhizosphaerae]